MAEKDCKKEEKIKNPKNWGTGGGLYKGVKASVKTLNYIIVVLIVVLIIVVMYLANNSRYVTNFEVNGGEAIPDVRNKYGDVVETTIPVKTGYTFDGWYIDKDLTKPWNIQEDTVTTSMILYAKWLPIKIHVILDLNGGNIHGTNETPDLNVVFHEPYGFLPTPEKSGSTFKGWQYDGTFIQAETIVSMNGEHTLKAIFE